MLRVVLVAVVALAAAPAFAGDKLLRGPMPEWVKPIEVKAPPLGDDGPAVRMLLEDHQLFLGPDGQSEFVEAVMQIRTPLGLASAGSLSLAWSPDIDTLTVHRLRILRDGKVFEVLDKQDFAVLRRETNLERAMLDGVLSATLQPEGLQAGDVVDLAYTRLRLDPVMQGRAEYSLDGRAYGRVERMRLRATWDAKRDVAWTAGSGLDEPKVARAGGRVEVSVDMKDVDSVAFPVSAPRRLYPTRDLAVSEFKTWAEVAALMAPHYLKAAQLEANSPLYAEVARIRAASQDPEARAGLALQLVEDQIRYLALTMKNGGYVPATADDTWRRRFGDCKAKTVLLMALLRELGIEAEAAVVNSTGGDFIGARPPGLTAFDHVIVRAVVDDKVYWLDGTRSGDRSLKALRVPAFGQALPLRASGSTLVALIQTPLGRPDGGMLLRIDASKGIDAPAPTHGEIVLGGDMGHYMGLFSSAMPVADREKALKQMWSSYRWIEPKTVVLTTDAATGQTKVVMAGTAKLEWLPKSNGPRWLYIPTAHLGGRTEYKREPGPGADAPWSVYGHPNWVSSTFQVVLPQGGEGFTIEGADVDAKAAGRAYMRKSRVEKGVATVETQVRTLAAEFPNSETAAAAETLTEMGKVRVGLRAPPFYRPTQADIVAWGAETPQTAADYIGRGIRYATVPRHDLAIADLDKAIGQDPKAAFAWANRGISHFWMEKHDLAAADYARTLELDPRNYVAIQGQGLLAMRQARYADAVAAFTRAADIMPKNTFALAQRAAAYWEMRDADKALADLAEIDRLEPSQVATALFRYEIYSARNERTRALAEVDEAIKKAPDDPRLHNMRGGMLALMGRPDEADKAFTRAVAIRPTVDAYLTRAHHRDPTDFAGRLADIELAENLEPGLSGTAAQRAEVLADAGRYDEALAGLERAIKAKPDDSFLIRTRAEVLLRAGRQPQAAKDIARLRTKAAGDLAALNSLCWLSATRNYELEAALADCDAALKLRPDSGPVTDSRALVLLRLNRLPEALAAYDEAVKLLPNNPESLYGRGLVRLRLGQTAEAETDFAAARAGSRRVDAEFAGYGLAAPRPQSSTRSGAAALPNGSWVAP